MTITSTPRSSGRGRAGFSRSSGTPVERHGGTIDQAGHDGVTAVFGLTVAREDDPLRAIRAALEMSDRTAADDVDPVILRIGVATGHVLAGPRTGLRSALVGAPLQAAARLATQAERREVLLTPETLRSIGAAASMEPMVFETVEDLPGESKVWRVIHVEGKRTATPRTVHPSWDAPMSSRHSSSPSNGSYPIGHRRSSP